MGGIIVVKLPENSIHQSQSYERANKTMVLDSLNNMKRFAKRLYNKTNLYFKTNDYEIKLDCLDSISSTYNNIIQNFMDLIDVIQINNQEAPCTSLRSYIRFYDSLDFPTSTDEKEMLYYFTSRNELIHDYMDYEYLADDTAKKIDNYGQGLDHIINHLEKFFNENSLLDKTIK